MQLGVYSLEKVLFQGAAREVNCRTRSGEITILDHHEPLISLLARGTVKVIDENGQESFFPVASGFLEINAHDEVKILVEERGETMSENDESVIAEIDAESHEKETF
jgi:F-type H+-transporting ATPase subunit epsilon